MLYEHEWVRIDNEENPENPIYRFAVEADAEFVRERLLECGTYGDLQHIEHALRVAWEYLLDEGLSDVLYTVTESMPHADQEWYEASGLLTPVAPPTPVDDGRDTDPDIPF